MNCNIGCFERSLRILVGAVLVTLAYTHQLNAWAYVGIVPLVTGIIRFCPLYAIINRNGCCKTEGKSSCSK
jgi:hypothetical protein